MKKTCLKIPVIATVMAIGIMAMLQPVLGASTTNYLNVASVANGGSYGLDNPYWNNTSETATPLIDYAASDAMCIGQNPSDYNGYAFSINFNYSASTHLTGSGGASIIIGSTNTVVTFNGADNDYLDAATTFIVAHGSTLIEDVDWDDLGLNFDNQTVTLNGGGTIAFQTPVGLNSTALITENMPGGSVVLGAGPPTKDDFTGGYTLTAGALIFSNSASASSFGGFPAGKNLTINGGSIDNTSGSGIALTWAGGGVSIGGNFTFIGSGNLSFGSAPVALTVSPVITVNSNTLTFGGPVSSTNVSGLTVIGGGTLALAASNSYSGATFVAGSGLALTANGSLSQSALVLSNAMLDFSGLAVPSVNPSLSLSNSTWNVSATMNYTNEAATTLNLGGATNIINISSLPIITGYPARFPLLSYGTLNGTYNIGLGTLPSSSSTPYVGNITESAGLVELVITSGPVPARQLTWTGTDPNNPNNWDVQTSLNWQTNGVATTFNPGDIVTFGDSAPGQTSIYLNGSLAPGLITVSNSALVYNLGAGGADGGEISGATSLTKEGTNLLVLDDAGGNSFTGGFNINNGTVVVGLGDGRGSVGAGPIADNGALVFNLSAHDSGLYNNISGLGQLTQEGADTLQLAGTNSFSGNILVVSNSTLQLGSALALSGTPVTTISNGSVLDVYGNTAGGIIMAQGAGTGNGAVINSSANIPPNDVGLTNLTLTGDTTIGITGARFDLRSPAGPSGNPGSAVLSTGGQPYNLIKSGSGGTGVFGLVGASVDPALGNIDIQAGDLQVAGNTTGLGNPSDTLTIESGATFELYAPTNQINKVIVFNDGGTLMNSSGTSTIIGPMDVTNVAGGDNYFDIAGTALVLSNTLTGNGLIFTEISSNNIYFNGNSPNFAGGIYLNTPTAVFVNGVLSNSLTIQSRFTGSSLTVNGQVLGAEIGPSFPGTISGSGYMNILDAAGPVYPGAAGVAGTMTVGNLILDGATVTFDLGANTTTGMGSNDLIAVTGGLTVNSCTINVNPTGLLQTGARYAIFTYAGTLSLNSAFTVVNSAGYTYSIDTSTQGVVNLVVSSGPPQWNGGSTSDSDWSDSANWDGSTLASGDFLYFGGNNRLNNTNDTAAGTQYGNIDFFSNAGAFVLNGNAITLVGSNIVNNSTAVQTIDLPLDFSTAQTISGLAGPIILGGGVTNTASSTTNYLNLTGTGILTNLLYSPNGGTNILAVSGATADWTLLDNPSSTPITVPWSLQISNGTFNFGNAGSAPTLTSLTYHDGPGGDAQVGYSGGGTATLNMTNGTLALNTLDTAQTASSTGVVNVAGGILNLGPIGSVASDYFQGANGAATNELSVVNISAGTINLGSEESNHMGTFYVASRGDGALTVSGAGTLNCGIIDVARNAQGNTFSSVGVINLNGGYIVASRVGTAVANSQTGPASNGSTPSATFNFNGGTLRAAASSTAFYQGSTVAPVIPITSFVQAGGAIIDSSNFDITVLEPLQHASALGATPDGGLIKLGSGVLRLTAASTYTGPTVVSNGTLAVNGSLADTAGTTVEAGGALAGTGSLGGNVTVLAGGAVAPGIPGTNGVGTNGILTVTGNVSLSANATAEMAINAATLTNSVLSAAAITYDGTLSVTNLSGTPALNDSFTLFKASSYSGAFTATNLPALSAGLGWNWNPATGTLNIVQTGAIPPTVPPVIKGFSLSGANVTISGTNAQIGATYYLLTTTNLVLPVSQWTAIATNVATGANNFSFIETNAVTPSTPNQFYILSSTNN